MKVCFASLVGLAGLASAVPTPEADPIRILPWSYTYELVSFQGPGCPKNDDSNAGIGTRTSFGQNTMDGTEIYYKFAAYPSLKASVGADEDEAHTWCESTFKYTEFAKDDKIATADYLLRLHKNGTMFLATNELDEGVTAKWNFTYYPEEDDEVVDTVNYQGPIKDDPFSSTTFFARSTTKPFAVTKCGSTTFKTRTDLYLTAHKKGAKGTVTGQSVVSAERTYNYGAQSGFSFDWQKCSK